MCCIFLLQIGNDFLAWIGTIFFIDKFHELLYVFFECRNKLVTHGAINFAIAHIVVNLVELATSMVLDIFLGLMTTYFVELFSGETVEITDVSSISNILPNGTKVSLTFDAEKINVFTTDGETSLTKGVNDDAHA